MNQFNYTIIIPHYNIPQLLERCIASIPNRNDVQIIVVDDCSPQTPLLRKTIEKIKFRQNLEVYYTNQGGSAGRARNIGLEHAYGKWIIFADADDFFESCLSDVMDRYVNAKEDVLYFNFRSVLSKNIQQKSTRESTYSEFFKQYKKDHKEENFRFLYCTPWAKIINRHFIESNKIRFEETRYANDAMFSALIGCKANTILPVDTPIYVLTERENSLTNQFCCKPGETIIRAQVALRIHKIIIDNGYTFSYDYQTYIRILLWNKEYEDLFQIYHTISKYNLTKHNILNIVLNTGKYYYIICLWLILKDMLFKILHK